MTIKINTNYTREIISHIYALPLAAWQRDCLKLNIPRISVWASVTGRKTRPNTPPFLIQMDERGWFYVPDGAFETEMDAQTQAAAIASYMDAALWKPNESPSPLANAGLEARLLQVEAENAELRGKLALKVQEETKAALKLIDELRHTIAHYRGELGEL